MFSTGIFTDLTTLADMETWVHTVPVYCPYCQRSHVCRLHDGQASADPAKSNVPRRQKN